MRRQARLVHKVVRKSPQISIVLFGPIYAHHGERHAENIKTKCDFLNEARHDSYIEGYYMRILWSVALLAATQQAQADELPDVLRCELTGSAGCAEGGICVGGGVPKSGIKLILKPRQRTIAINGLIGHIPDGEEVDAPGVRYVQWRFGIIGLDQLRVERRQGQRLTVELSGPSEAPNQQVASFTCSRD